MFFACEYMKNRITAIEEPQSYLWPLKEFFYRQQIQNIDFSALRVH